LRSRTWPTGLWRAWRPHGLKGRHALHRARRARFPLRKFILHEILEKKYFRIFFENFLSVNSPSSPVEKNGLEKYLKVTQC
jgi:hypothetical protein